jgi:hypothetical protein
MKTLLLAIGIAIFLNVFDQGIHHWRLQTSGPYRGVPFYVLVTKIPVTYWGSEGGHDYFRSGWWQWSSYFKLPQTQIKLPHRFSLGQGSYFVDYRMASLSSG